MIAGQSRENHVSQDPEEPDLTRLLVLFNGSYIDGASKKSIPKMVFANEKTDIPRLRVLIFCIVVRDLTR